MKSIEDLQETKGTFAISQAISDARWRGMPTGAVEILFTTPTKA